MENQAQVDKTNLSVLTVKQRQAYELRQSGLTFREIGERMGITADAARQNFKGAERRLMDYAKYQRVQEQNYKPVDFPLTRGELKIIIEGLRKEASSMISRRQLGSQADWRNNLPYSARVLRDLLARAEIEIYGVAYPSILD